MMTSSVFKNQGAPLRPKLPRMDQPSLLSRAKEPTMRRFVAVSILLLACSFVTVHAWQAGTPAWEKQRICDNNKEAPHPTFVPSPDEATARRGALAYAPGAPPAPA